MGELKVKTIRGQVYQILRNDICGGKYEPGFWLQELEPAEETWALLDKETPKALDNVTTLITGSVRELRGGGGVRKAGLRARFTYRSALL